MAVKERSESHAFGVDLVRNCVYMSDGEIVPITDVIGRGVVAGPTLSGKWITSQMTDDEYVYKDEWRAWYAERAN